jgi:hypothetical protein
VPAIAARLRLDQKKLYKRLDKLFVRLRTALAEAGLRARDIADLLSHSDSEVSIDLSSRSTAPAGKTAAKPSHRTGRKRGNGPSRVS